MQHKILVGWSKALAADLANELLITHLESHDVEIIRVTVSRYAEFCGEDSVLLVDARVYTKERFGYFLKILEDPNLPGSIWFYGAVLSKYPFTIRSRCQVVAFQAAHEKDIWKNYCSTMGQVEYYPMILNLKQYDSLAAYTMLENKDRFVDVLYGLEITMNFNTYRTSLEQVDVYFLFLYIEWLNKNPIFSEKQLELCPFLREKKFIRMFGDLSNWHCPNKEQAVLLFTFMFAYKAISV